MSSRVPLAVGRVVVVPVGEDSWSGLRPRSPWRPMPRVWGGVAAQRASAAPPPSRLLPHRLRRRVSFGAHGLDLGASATPRGMGSGRGQPCPGWRAATPFAWRRGVRGVAGQPVPCVGSDPSCTQPTDEGSVVGVGPGRGLSDEGARSCRRLTATPISERPTTPARTGAGERDDAPGDHPLLPLWAGVGVRLTATVDVSGERRRSRSGSGASTLRAARYGDHG
jgi:hypothetical protein